MSDKKWTASDVPSTIELSDYLKGRIAEISNGDSPRETIAKILAKGIYAIDYARTMQLRKRLQESIGKSVVKGEMERVAELALELKATYKDAPDSE